MHEGASRRGAAGRGGTLGTLVRAAAGLALLVSFGCGAAESDDGGSNGSPGGAGTGAPLDWRFGGQTGSLMPSCGLAPVARLQGVPASSAFVVYTAGCPGAPGAELALVDAQGNAVPVQTQELASGTVLVAPPAGLSPGSYTLTNLQVPTDDERDGGDDGDAGLDRSAGPDAGAAPAAGETVVVIEPSAAPTRLGELRQTGQCSAGLELVLDPSVVPHLHSLALDLRVAGGSPQRVVPFGAAMVSSVGAVHVAVPLQQLPAPGNGSVIVEVQGIVAGEPFAVAPAMLALTCSGGATSQPSPDAWSDHGEDGGCSVSRARPGPVRAPLIGIGAASLAIGLYRRRRRNRLRSS
jgi:hypothetical protein